MKLLLLFWKFVKDAWTFLYFFFYFGCAWLVKAWLARRGFELPRFAHWEIAALIHVFHFAWEMMDFKGFTFVSRRFNALTKKLVLVIVALLLFIKAVIIFVETKQINLADNSRYALVEFSGSARSVETFVQFAANYIMVAPLFLFLIVNSIALRQVRKETAQLGLRNTAQEQYLKKIRNRVDFPPIALFGVLWTIFSLDKSFDDNTTIVGVLSCSALTISNFLAAPLVKRGEEIC